MRWGAAVGYRVRARCPAYRATYTRLMSSNTTTPNSVRRHLPVLLAVVVPALVTLIVGLTHPMFLGASTATWWRNLHIILLPVFPLIGVAPWLVSRGSSALWRRLAGFGGFLFSMYYTALDALAGIAAGSVQLAGHPEAKHSLYALADIFGPIGAWGLALAWAAATIGAVRRSGAYALPGLLGIVGALCVWTSHILFPVGTVGLALLIVAAVVLAWRATLPSRAQGPAPAS